MVENVSSEERGAARVAETTDTFPVLQQRRDRPIDIRVDIARRELWRAFQRGALSEDELGSTLDRLEFTPQDDH